LLWEDVWNGHNTMTEFPRLYSFVRNNKTSVSQFIANNDTHLNFHTPIFQEAAQEPIQLNQIINQAQHSHLEKDQWTYICGNATYTSSRYYAISFRTIEAPTPLKWIWKARISKKIKILIWLMFRDKINS
jgi:hypothetical protein